MILCLSAGISSLSVGDVKAETSDGSGDPNIIIFSRSHGSVSYETQKSGNLQIGVTSFFPIRSVMVNDDSVSGAGDSVADITFPYQLDLGKNEFIVVVETKKGKSEKQYTIHLDEKQAGTKKHFK